MMMFFQNIFSIAIYCHDQAQKVKAQKKKKGVIFKSMSDLSLSPAHKYHNGKVAHFTKLASKYIIALSYHYLLRQGHGKKSPEK